MKKETFLKRFNLTEDQFTGKEKVGGSLYLSSLTSLPEGFNPTVGGYLDLSSLTSLPEGFNPTVGGSLDLRSLTSLPEGFNPTVGGDLYLSSLTSLPEGFNPTVGGFLYLSSLTSLPEGFNPTVGGSLYWNNRHKYIGASVRTIEVERPKIKRDFFWVKGDKEYAWIDGLFCQILHRAEHSIGGEACTILSAKRINKKEEFCIANQGDFYAHGDDLKKAFEDLRFKIAAEKIKKEPITPETIITVQHYRIITGACEMGCKQWMEQNNIKVGEIKAAELLPLLEKTHAYGVERFKKLYTNQ